MYCATIHRVGLESIVVWFKQEPKVETQDGYDGFVVLSDSATVYYIPRGVFAGVEVRKR